MKNIQSNRGEGDLTVIAFIGLSLFLLVCGVGGCMWGMPLYKVYDQRKEGEALLAHSQASKEVAVSEARAKLESATLLAGAEVERAKGVAAANKIIGDSLKDNEAYLRYLWVTDVAGNAQGKTVVYIPTEAQIPVLEATRHEK